MTEKRRADGEKSPSRNVILCRCWTAILLLLAAFDARATIDLVVNSTDSPDPVVTLSNLTYTITVTNTGTTIATNVSITNVLSSRVNFLSVTNTRGSCSNVAGIVCCDWGNVTNGTGGRVTIVARPLAPGFVTNVVSAGSIEADATPTNNTSTQTTAVVNRRVFGSSDFIQMQDVLASPATPYPSTINVSGLTAAVYKVTVTLTNFSHSGPDDVDVVLVGPTGAYIMLLSDGPITPAVTDATITFDDAAAQFFPDLTPIVPGTFKPANYGNVDDIMPAPAPPGPYAKGFPVLSIFNQTNPNGAWRLFVYDDESEAGGWIDGWGITLLTMESMANLGVSVTGSPDPALPGQTITYSATVTNTGPVAASGLRLTNRVPAGLEIISYSATRGTCANAGGIITCDIGDLAVGGSEQFALQVRALNGGTYTNQTEVSSDQLDTQPANNIALQTTTVQPRVDVGIDMSASRTPALLEQPLVYVLSVTNLGPDPATGVRVVNELPPGVLLVNASASQGSCTNQSGIVTCNLNTVTNRGRANVVLTCRPTVLGPITNIAAITCDQVDTNPTNNAAQNVNSVDPAADVQLSLTDSPDPVLVGQPITYTIVLTNRGPNLASNLVVSDVLPGSLRFVSAQTTHGACTNDGNSVGCAINELPVGQRATITVLATAIALGNVANGASVTVQPIDPNTFNNIANVSTLVLAAVDLSITKAGEAGVVWQGDRVTYNLVVSNSGPSTATAARLQDVLPGGMSFVSAATTVGFCTFQSGTVTCNFGDLAPTGSVRVSIIGTVAPTGFITNTANTFANEQDVNSANNSATAVTQVLPRTFSATDTNGVVLPEVGTASVYPLTVNVSGMTAAVQRVRVALLSFSHSYPDDLDMLLVGPGGQSVVLMSDAGGSTAVSNLDLTIDDLASSILPDNGPLTAFYYRPADYNDGTSVEFPAPAPAGPYGTNFDVFTHTDPNGTWKLYVVDDTVKDQGAFRGGWRLDIWGRDQIADLGLSAFAAPDLVAVGSNVTVAVTVSNRGPGTATAVVLTNAYGSNLVFSGAAASQGSCTNDNGIIRCSLGDIAAGSSAFVQMSLASLVAGTISNFVGVAASSVDFTPTNNVTAVVFAVERPPAIVTQPRDQHISAGGTAHFEVTVSGDPPLVYHWYHNGTLIPGASTATLPVNNVQTDKLGLYHVEISNRVAAVSSVLAQLTFTRAPALGLIADQLVDEDTLLTVSLPLSDPDNPGEVFQLSAVCDDTNLVPTTNFTFIASGTNYSLLILPGTNQFGTNVITITLTDSAGLSASRSFALGVQSVNDYPVFVNRVGDQVMREDGTLQVFFQVADVETPVHELIVAARSYNQELMPDNGLTWGLSGGNGNVIMTPTKNRSGTALMEIRVRDGAGVRSTNLFILSVLPVSDPPTISSIDDATIPEDGELTVSFVVNDLETAAGDLAVRAESSNQALFSNDAFAFALNGGFHTLTVHPIQNQSGESRITVFVQDGDGMAASNSFRVTVTPVNDPPFLSEIPEIVTAMDQTSAEVAFTIGDAESSPNDLTLTAISTNTVLAPLSGIHFAGTASNRTVRVTPGVGQIGWTVLQVSVADTNGGVTIRDFELFVHQTNGAPMIVRQPLDQDLLVGIPLNLRVIAKGPGKLRYQWQHDGQELHGQTNATFAIAAVVGADRGEYRVRITNDEGTTLSDAAQVTVLEATRILTVKRIAQTVELTFGTVSGYRYIAEYQDSLGAAWTALAEVIGTGQIFTFTDPNAPGGTRFYRVRVELNR